jgi:hypothetical protein
MDILVRVPKKEVAHFWDDAPSEATHEFWSLARVPKSLKVHDRIWFQIEDEVVAYAVVSSIAERGTETCLSTHRGWTGCLVYWPVEAFHKLARPQLGHKIMRGYMYASYLER